ncbi:MAG: polysaccharide biosynthesis/export family protein [Pseudomonadota bacterium]
MTRFLAALRNASLGLLAACALAVPALSQQAEYQLHPGDQLSLSMPGLTAQTWESTIDMTGRAHFPFFGAVPAAGLTLPELSTQIEIAATGLEVPIFDGGRAITSLLSGDDVFVQVARYRPVTVVGDVAQPGTVEFMPGQTVRAVLGTAGGFRLAELALTRVPADATVRLQTALETRKWLRAQVARTELLLDVEDDVSELTPTQRALFIDLLGEEEGASVIAEIELVLSDRQYTAQDLSERINLTRNRVESLRQAYTNYENASAVEEDRLQRLITMDERGLVTADRLDTARNAALQASTRLLTVSADVYETEVELRRLEEDLARLDDAFHIDALDDKRRFTQQLAEVSAQVASLRLLLLTEDASSDEGVVTTTRILIHRQTGNEEETFSAAMGDFLFPGDVLEVIASVSEAVD